MCDYRNNNDPLDVCVVCCRNITIYAVGICDHPVCFECSTRMRVLCRQNECPICRQDMPKVFFTETLQKFADIQNQTTYAVDKKHRICMESAFVQEEYNKLLEHTCVLCGNRPIFRNFNLLKDHMRKEHERFFCDLCIDNLKIFSFERKSYTRSDLARHRRIGDPDNKSHRGHPICEFCDERYLDRDELFRHLRRDHYFCHFCDADGLHEFYSDYEFLRRHFQEQHFLCEEGTCREEKFTSVFRSDIDLRAHKATVHNKSLTKAQAKQARTLELEFTITPWNDGDDDSHSRRRRGNFRSKFVRQSRDEDAAVGGPEIPVPQPQFMGGAQKINMNCSKEFPTLSGAEANSSTQASGQSSESLAQKLAKKNRFTVRAHSDGKYSNDDEFPALESASGFISKNQGGATNVTYTSAAQPSLMSSGATSKTLLFRFNNNPEDFPSINNTTVSTCGPANVSIQVSRTQNVNVSSTSASFAKGTSGASSQNQAPRAQVTKVSASKNITFQEPSNSTNSGDCPQWITVKPTSKNKAKPFQTDQRTKLSILDDDFPVLSKIGKNSQASNTIKKASSVKIGVNGYCLPEESVNGQHPKTSDTDSLNSKSKTKKKKTKNSGIAEALGLGVNSKETNVAVTNESNKKKKNLHINESSSSENSRKNSTENHENEKPEVVMNLEASKTTSTVIADPVNKKDSEFKKARDVSKTKRLVMDDFPSLPKPASTLPFSTVSELKLYSSCQSSPPPPGFNTFSASSSSSQAPPPGFSVTLNSLVRPSNEGSLVSPVTFTSSNGESFSLSSPRQPYYVYTEPENFQKRNQDLIKTIQVHANNDSTKFQMFRTLSGQFRQGVLSANDYHEKCIELIGQEAFLQIFPELLVLLPDINKQQELLTVHNNYRKREQKNAASQKDSRHSDNCNIQFLVCATCQQVLASRDFRIHMDIHNLDSNFPSLSLASQTASSLQTSWVKK